MVFLKNKKAVTEITSFVLLILIVVTASSFAYFFAKDMISSSVSKIDINNMETYFKMFQDKLDLINSFNTATSSVNIHFQTGQLYFVNNSVSYHSLIKYDSSSTCVNSICYKGVGGFEVIYFNTSNNYNFTSNLSLSPGSYKIIFQNLKNESKISISIN